MLTVLREYRVVTLCFLLFACWEAKAIAYWYMSLVAPNNSQGAFASAVMLALIGIGKYWMETKHNDTK